jgi:predicted nucleic acid-binding protein
VTFIQGQPVIVVDASVAVPILQRDGVWTEMWASWLGSNAILLCPPHFQAEVANALLRSLRLPALDVANRIARLWTLGVEVADRGRLAMMAAIDLAERRGLTVYDAAYLELAIDVDGQLATQDGELRAAALAEQVSLVDETEGWAAAATDPQFQEETRQIARDFGEPVPDRPA